MQCSIPEGQWECRALPCQCSAAFLPVFRQTFLFCLAVSEAGQETGEEDEAGRVQLFQGKNPSPGWLEEKSSDGGCCISWHPCPCLRCVIAMILETTLVDLLFLFLANTKPAAGYTSTGVAQGSSCCHGAGYLVASERHQHGACGL